MKTLNTFSKIIQSIKSKLIKSDSIINIEVEDAVVVNDSDQILFQLNHQEDEFLFI